MLGRRRRQEEENAGPGEWILTYSDFITLVLTFFILLYSFSNLDVQKFRVFIASFQGVGIMNQGPQPLENQRIQIEQEQIPMFQPNPSILEAAQREQQKVQEIFAQVKAYLEQNGLEDKVELRYTDRGVALDVKERILFDTGKADLKPEARTVLDRLAGLFGRLPYQIQVEGHTDIRPIHTVEFPTNWELSTARSARVVRYFTEVHGLDPRKFAAVGYGEFRPLVPNDSEENMALNRRVVMVILVAEAAETGGSLLGQGH
ncbi:MAG: flagellar motor protein MotB [Moorellales bacterium]